MKKFLIIPAFFLLTALLIFGEDQEEVDFLLFLPNSPNRFVNEEQAKIQLDNIADYLNGKNLTPGQIQVYGYTAEAVSDAEPGPLSEERAFFVIGELRRRGVPGDWFADPVGFGSVNLWGSNLDEENRLGNRRVRVLLDGSILTAQTVEPEVIIMSEEKETISITADENKEKKQFKFPWIILLIPLLLLLFLLFKNRKKPAEKKPEAFKKPAVQTLEPAAEREPVIISEYVKTLEPVKTNEPLDTAAPAVKSESTVYLEEEIRFRAYEIYKDCGSIEDAERDWYIALPEVCLRYEARGYRTYIENGCWWAKKVNN